MPNGDSVDLLVIGGGINGAGIARDAAGRGLKVLLAEQGDLAQGTSSASTKLIHGGLRYLEYYEFRLVREALKEREVLLANAPHIIWPLRFVLPHADYLRPAWMIRLGLLLYDHIGGRVRLPASRGVDLRSDPAGAPLKPKFTRGFSYSDCWVEDSRLVVLNAMDAAERGAAILTRTRCVSARPSGRAWQVLLQDLNGSRRTVAAQGLVNAAGPWISEVAEKVIGRPLGQPIRLVKGSHIVVPRLFEGEEAYILQNEDRRIVFAIPYERHFTLIGTTDLNYVGDPADATISREEIDYLCQAVGSYFRRPVTAADPVWTYSGVRPLYDDRRESASAVTRDYVLHLDTPEGAPLLSVYGGKITTYRRLAEHALEKLAPHYPNSSGPWTARAPLPGGDIPDGDFDRFLAGLIARRPWLPKRLARRWARAYGTRVETMIGGADGTDELGRHYGEDLYQCEIDYLIQREWARASADILWRRSKLGLHLSPATVEALRQQLGETGPLEEDRSEGLAVARQSGGRP
ncbi:MAG TPA: glycerol-3-phosphate dehydrogenase [Alphaproteobacteria bacterium]|nr:glycerol-3-phosphate dehydrogenase [Alphaproteobacteria bacterium]